MFRFCWHLRIDDFVVQIISLCYFQQIFWYTWIFVSFLFIGSFMDLRFTVDIYSEFTVDTHCGLKIHSRQGGEESKDPLSS